MTVEIERVSELLFGRYQALSIYTAIAGLAKPEFTTGEVASLTGVALPVCSKELRRLSELGAVRSVSRRGAYERVSERPFWLAVGLLADDAT